MKLNQLCATEMSERLQSGECSSEQIVEACLERIQARDNDVQAWQYLDPEYALEQARTRDKSAPGSPMHGVPIGIKDIIDTADMPTDYGSKIYDGHQPSANAACVELLKDAGAVILGKTVTTEFAYLEPGDTRNPHDLEHTPGGSSSGSAAAVADYHLPIALGTQTAGSIIRPASYCGVVGFKPSFDSYPAAGIHPFAQSLDTLGGFARKVADIVLLADVLGGEKSDFEAMAPTRIAMVRGPAWSEAGQGSREVLEQSRELLLERGTTVEEVPLPVEFDEIIEAQKCIQLHECTRTLSSYYENSAEKMSRKLRVDYEHGLGISDATMKGAYALVEKCKHSIARLFSDYDLLLTPASSSSAPLANEGTGDPVFNRMWTALHLPCISLPFPRPSGNLPIGLQLVGGYRNDSLLLAHAACIEQWFAE